MRIVVEGCAHGDLDRIYGVIQSIEQRQNRKFDLLICCGDFQSTRNLADLSCMAVPSKYLDMCSFYKYYSGEKVAPLLTIFIGGNHEASNYLQELAYGGWVAPNIYYLGYAGVVNVDGIRIAGISGIFRDNHFEKGHFEFPPYDQSTMRSAYAIRSIEVFRLSQLTGNIDIMLSHDWPDQIWEYGNKEQLLRFKPYFREDMDSGKLGSGPCWDLLTTLKPKNWYAAHMHCRFDARVDHSETEFTRFVALDKCLPNRKCLDFITIGEEGEKQSEESQESSKERKIPTIKYDLEWLTVLNLTNNLLNVNRNYTKLPLQPGPDDPQDHIQRFEFTPSQEEMEAVLKKMNNDLTIPQNFVQTAPAYNPQVDGRNFRNVNSIPVVVELNPQTTEICEKIGLDDPLYLTAKFSKIDLSTASSNFGPETSEKDASPSVPVVQRAPLASFLPQPKFFNEDEINLDEIDDENEEEVKEKIKEISAAIVETPPQPLSADENPNPIKKFKRRNQEIYANEDEA